MKKWWYIGLVGMLFLSACKERKEGEPVPTKMPGQEQNKEDLGGGQDGEVSGEKEPTQSVEKEENIPTTVAPTSVPEWIVEGKDIGSATSIASLKDLYAPYFKMGVGLTGYAPEVMMITSEAMSEVVKYHFNSTTLTNLMKPSYLLDQKGSIQNIKDGVETPAVKFDACIDALDFCKENGIGMRGHQCRQLKP